MRRALALLASMLLGACQAYQPTAPAPSLSSAPIDSAAELRAKTVALVHDESAYCSGVWVSPTLIVTAAHCVKGELVEYVVSDDVYGPNAVAERARITSRPAALLALDPSHDLALLRAVHPPLHPYASTSFGAIVQGSKAYAMGHALGMWWSYSSGDVAALRDDDGTWEVQATTPISPGNSGGGLFDGEGHLIGIAHGFYPQGQNVNLFIHRKHVDALLALVTL